MMTMMMIISCAMHSKIVPTTAATPVTATAATYETTHAPVSIVHSGEVIVRQIDAPIQPILVYHKFHIDNGQTSVHSLLHIGNWINATRTIATNNTIQYNEMEQLQQQNAEPVPVVWHFVKWFYYMKCKTNSANYIHTTAIIQYIL